MVMTPFAAVLIASAALAAGLILGRATARFGPHLGASLKRQRFNGVTVFDGVLTGRAGGRSRTELSVYFVVKRAPRPASAGEATRDAVTL